jgi:hypothetical protein
MDDLEQRLRRYRPIGPPADLRARVISTAGMPAPRRWAWVPSATAAAAAVTFYVLSAGVRRDVVAELMKTDPQRDAIVRALAADLGGDEEARKVAARVIEMSEATIAAPAEPGATSDVENDRHE